MFLEKNMFRRVNIFFTFLLYYTKKIMNIAIKDREEIMLLGDVFFNKSLVRDQFGWGCFLIMFRVGKNA